MRRVLTTLDCALPVTAVDAREPSFGAAKSAFVHANPGPATGATKVSCPGCVIDHLVPAYAGGEDARANMQRETTVATLEKDKNEWRQCCHYDRSGG